MARSLLRDAYSKRNRQNRAIRAQALLWLEQRHADEYAGLHELATQLLTEDPNE